MPMPKGARKDPDNPGKYIMPEGHVKKAEAERRRNPEPTAYASRVEARFSEERKNSRNFVFRIQVVHPSGKYWIADTQDYSPQMLATNYGGGKFEVWKMDTSTGQPMGDPLPYNVDTNVHPQRLFDPAMSPQGGMQGRFGGQGPTPAWQGGNAGYGAPGAFGGPSAWPAVTGGPSSKELTDLEDELEDLEKDLEKANVLASTYLRERDEARAQLVELKAAADKKELMSMFATQLEAAKGGAKDPMEQMLQMIRLQAEMSGGVIGKQGGGTDTITGAVALMNVILSAAKSVPQADTGGGALGGLIQVASQYLPLVTQIVQGKATGAPAPQVVVDERPKPAAQAPAPQPAPPVDQNVGACFHEAVKVIPGYITGDSEAYADWIVKQTAPGWPELHKILMAEKPEAFLTEAMKVNAEIGDSDFKKQWIVQAIASAQAKLLNAQAK